MLITVTDRIQGGSSLTKIVVEEIQSLSYPGEGEETYSLKLRGRFFSIVLDEEDGERVDMALEELRR